GAVRVFDAEAIRKFLAAKPTVVIAVGNDGQKEVARKLAADLTARGVPATVKPEAEVLHKVHYPRVWNPYAQLYTATGDEKKPAKMEVKTRLQVGLAADGKLTVKTAKGKDGGADWKQPNSLVTVT